MGQRRTARLAGIAAGAAVAIGCCLAIPGCSAGSVPAASPAPGNSAPVSTAPGSSAPGSTVLRIAVYERTGPRSTASRRGHHASLTRTLAADGTLAACEQRLESGPRSVPTLAIVGASYTAGVGPGNPALSWAAVLARRMRWDAVIYGVSGAGYVRPGDDDLGPAARLLKAEGLHRLHPALVIIQAGHDDSGIPAGVERRQVRRALELIRAEAPHARIALLTVFTSPARPVPDALVHIDKAIVAAARAADPSVIIMDPLTGDWTFAHEHHALHPTAAGDAWIARKVAAILRAHRIDPAPRTATAPVVCDRAVRVTSAGD